MGKHAQLGVIVHELIELISKDKLDIVRAKLNSEEAINA